LLNTCIQNYRYWIIWRIPSIRFLDFQKVKDVERQGAKELFGTEEEPSELASKIIGMKSRTFDVGAASTNGRAAPAEKAMRVKMTDTEKKRVEKMIREAKSLQEIARLEKELHDGRIPAGAADEDRMTN
jgi:U2 small nuclear ribonucleoprotein A'